MAEVTKIRPVHYNTPRRPDMAIVLVFFNPQRSIRVVQNILTVVHYLKAASIPHYIHELAFNDEPHLFAPAENVKLSRSTSYMFYKENLIHTLLPQIPAKFTKICIMDADIFFDDPDWYTITSAALDIYDVCQPFTTTYFLGPDYKPIKQLTNCVDSNNSQIIWQKEHPGHIWAFERKWYDDSNIPDLTIIGGGDFVLTNAVKGIAHRTATFLLYEEIIPKDIHLTTTRGSCELTIYHLYHGSEVNRQYAARADTITDLLKREGLTVKTAIQRRRDGILEWIPEKRDIMNEFMRGYFGRRNDDLVKAEFISRNKLFTPGPYSYPVLQDMVVVIPFFNPVQYIRNTQNIIIMVHWLEQARIPYYIAELAYKKNPFLFKAASNIIQFRSESNLFYKENLVDVIEHMLPKVYTKICMMDADILFNKPDWYTQTSQLLDTHDICQPFTYAIWTHADFTEYRRRTHCLGSSLSVINWLQEHPGFVWAFRRDWYCEHPYRYIPICTTGGDTILHDFVKGRHTSLYKYYSKYYDEFESKKLSVRYTWLDCDIYHLNHGSYDKRMYPDYVEDVRKLLERYGYSMPHEAVERREDGILEWKPDCRAEINAFNQTYFLSRTEDDV
jgi:hypothetical protein